VWGVVDEQATIVYPCKMDYSIFLDQKHFTLHFTFTHCVQCTHSDYRTVSPYWVLPVYVELIRAVWADDGGKATIILMK
jgi:hypothetical protein